MVYVAFILIVIIGWYLTTNYQANKDGVTNALVFKYSWWPCYKANNTMERSALAIRFHFLSFAATTPDEKEFYEQCFTVACNYIKRSTNGQLDFAEVIRQERESGRMDSLMEEIKENPNVPIKVLTFDNEQELEEFMKQVDSKEDEQ